MNESAVSTKRSPKMTKEQRQEAVRMYERGIQIVDIAEFYEVSKQYISIYLQKNGIQLKKKHKFATPQDWDKQNKTNQLVFKAIKSGVLIPQPCEVCGITGTNAAGHNLIHAHHDDYNKPLYVRWLCQKHHAEWHAVHAPIRIIDNS